MTGSGCGSSRRTLSQWSGGLLSVIAALVLDRVVLSGPRLLLARSKDAVEDRPEDIDSGRYEEHVAPGLPRLLLKLNTMANNAI